MPFGLKNAPVVFQHLMHQVFMGLNPENGHDFAAVYLDDIIVTQAPLKITLYT